MTILITKKKRCIKIIVLKGFFGARSYTSNNCVRLKQSKGIGSYWMKNRTFSWDKNSISVEVTGENTELLKILMPIRTNTETETLLE